MSFLENPLAYLKGVGPIKAELLAKELNLFTYQDLLNHFPFRHIDKTHIYTIQQLNSSMDYVQVEGVLESYREEGKLRNRRLIVNLINANNDTLELIWFKGFKWILETLPMGKKVVVFGRLSHFLSHFQIIHPEIEIKENHLAHSNKLEPIYSTTERLKARGFFSKTMAKLVYHLLQIMPANTIVENLPQNILQKHNFILRQEAYKQIHFPDSIKNCEQAKKRLIFEEFFIAQARLAQVRTGRYQYSKGFKFEKLGNHFNTFYNQYLPFELTQAQKRVLKEIRKDMLVGYQMNRLLQGDVGSGKTIVALMSALIAIDNGYQVCLMAPTEILANQHFRTLSKLTEKLGIKMEILTSSIKGKSRKELLENLVQHKIHFLIGTHAVIEKKVEFANLGLAIIDEQHKFGVEQRGALWAKNEIYPHILVMTATPIPRTLAMTAYGDLDYSVIDELPPGRKPIQTIHKLDSLRPKIIDFLKQQIAQGRQIYIVFPLIEESETLDYQNLMQGIDYYQSYFREPHYYLSVLHGRLDPAIKNTNMERFVKGETQIMLSTTVIEVGVNVPNASVMVIESAEKFGLSQLHQLRGRVGRGSDKSYCILLTSAKLSQEAKQRMSILCQTNDGFVIAEKDLEMRGPGEIEGTKQSGLLNFKIANLVKDKQLLLLAKEEIANILNQEGGLENLINKPLKDFLVKQDNTKNNLWKKIS